jgi:Lrp/AsnC family transcriptional regulator for asnA, asnC and gidA
MGVHAYIFVHTDTGRAVEVVLEARKIDKVKEAHAITGVYDVIIKVEAENIEDLENTIIKKIQGIKGVRGTATSLIIH